ncbi:MAG: Fic family protein [Hyphomicrobiales bacterium]|nr:Fic family protein [Hyphomicrobiales bacterium]
MTDEKHRRNTRALEQPLISDPIELARAEARNGLKQFDAAMSMAQTAIERGNFKFRPSQILPLHREAMQGLTSYAGTFRPGPVEIGESTHQPPAAHLVPELIEDMCDYVNSEWAQSALYLSAYVMWRLNWIHPFADGNGRTSRIASYFILCIRSGSIVPGTPTIPDQIVGNRTPYFQALEAADHACEVGEIDVSVMETLLERLLAAQLSNYFRQSGGQLPDKRTD